jgi:hypothetical protein
MTSKDTLSSGELAERLLVRAHSIDVLAGFGEDADLMREAAALLRTLSPRGGSIGSSGGFEKDIGSSAALSPRSAKCAEAGKDDGVDWPRIYERREQFAKDLQRALADPDNRVEHPLPWTCAMVIHDGPGVQFFDANGKPVLGPDLLRDTEDAAQLLFSINAAPVSSEDVAPAHPQAADEQKQSDNARIERLTKLIEALEMEILVQTEPNVLRRHLIEMTKDWRAKP